MTWNCQCELCRRARRDKLYDSGWLDLLHHTDGVILRADYGDDEPVYLTKLDREIYSATDDMDEPKPLRETWIEEVVLIDHLRSCEVDIVEGYRTPFKYLLRERANSTV
jgi:hypothetical protein